MVTSNIQNFFLFGKAVYKRISEMAVTNCREKERERERERERVKKKEREKKRERERDTERD